LLSGLPFMHPFPFVPIFFFFCFFLSVADSRRPCLVSVSCAPIPLSVFHSPQHTDFCFPVPPQSLYVPKPVSRFPPMFAFPRVSFCRLFPLLLALSRLFFFSPKHTHLQVSFHFPFQHGRLTPGSSRPSFFFRTSICLGWDRFPLHPVVTTIPVLLRSGPLPSACLKRCPPPSPLSSFTLMRDSVFLLFLWPTDPRQMEQALAVSFPLFRFFPPN